MSITIEISATSEPMKRLEADGPETQNVVEACKHFINFLSNQEKVPKCTDT